MESQAQTAEARKRKRRIDEIDTREELAEGVVRDLRRDCNLAEYSGSVFRVLGIRAALLRHGVGKGEVDAVVSNVLKDHYQDAIRDRLSEIGTAISGIDFHGIERPLEEINSNGESIVLHLNDIAGSLDGIENELKFATFSGT